MTDAQRTMIKRWMWGLGALGAFLVLVWQLQRLATLVFLTFIVAYILNPVVTRFSRARFLNRMSATALTLIGLALIFGALMLVIIPDVIDEFRAFVERLPELTAQLQATAIPWVEKSFDVIVPRTWSGVFDQLRTTADEDGKALLMPAAEVARTLFGTLVGTTGAAVFTALSALMFPLFVFFLTKDFPRIIGSVDGLVPARYREQIRGLAVEVDKSLSAFLHGQFTVMVVLGTLYSIGYSIVGIPVAIGVGLLTGLLCFIPYAGAATGFGLALLLAILSMEGWSQILGVAIVFGVVQALDATVITPRILGGKLGLRPLWIIVALMAGGELFGFLGVLLAVPIAAVAKVLIAHTVALYRASDVFRGEPPAVPPSERP
jgi:predicted PurR-regulated permease PerM